MHGRLFQFLILTPVTLYAAITIAQAQLRGHGGPVRAVAVSPDGRTIVSGSFDTSAIQWSLAANTAERVLRFHGDAVNAVAFLNGWPLRDCGRGRQDRDLERGQG